VPRGSVIGHLTAAFDLAMSSRRGRFHDIDQRRRERGNARQPAALSVGRMRSFLRGRFAVQGRRYRAVAGIRVRISAEMVVHVAVLVDMLHRYIIVHVDHAGSVTGVGQARRNGLRAGQREGDRRRQHAKKIYERKHPACTPSPRCGQPHKHP